MLFRSQGTGESAYDYRVGAGRGTQQVATVNTPAGHEGDGPLFGLVTDGAGHCDRLQSHSDASGQSVRQLTISRNEQWRTVSGTVSSTGSGTVSGEDNGRTVKHKTRASVLKPGA